MINIYSRIIGLLPAAPIPQIETENPNPLKLSSISDTLPRIILVFYSIDLMYYHIYKYILYHLQD